MKSSAMKPQNSLLHATNMGILYGSTNSDVLSHTSHTVYSVDIHMNIPSNKLFIIYTLNILLVSCLPLNTGLDICSAILWVWSAAVCETHHYDVPPSVQVQHLHTRVSYFN